MLAHAGLDTISLEESTLMDTFPDLGSLGDQELKDLIQQLTQEEVEVSYRRRILHGKIDILRAELVNRLRKKNENGEDLISGADVQRLTDILVGTQRTPGVMAHHCPECGFANAEGANYCQKCGAFVGPMDSPKEPATATYRIDETGDLVPVELEDVVAEEGAALVIRAGGGRVGESFALDGDRITIGRRPDCAVFLDDVTVSRDHALIVRRGGDWHLDDLGSLNGTYVNRHRIETHHLQDGDELQVGKYKLTFLSR